LKPKQTFLIREELNERKLSLENNSGRKSASPASYTSKRAYFKTVETCIETLITSIVLVGILECPRSLLVQP